VWVAQERQSTRRLLDRCPLWCENPARHAMSVSRDGKRALPASWWIEHGTEDGGRNRAYSEGCNQTRPVFREGKSGAALLSRIVARVRSVCRCVGRPARLLGRAASLISWATAATNAGAYWRHCLRVHVCRARLDTHRYQIQTVRTPYRNRA